MPGPGRRGTPWQCSVRQRSLPAACRKPWVRGYPAPCSLVGGGPVRVPGGLAHRTTPAPGGPWRTRTQAWPWALSDRPTASVGHWAFLLGLGLVLPKPTSLCWPGVGWSGREGSPLSYPLQGPLLRWLKVHFSEAFVAWIHIKALRVFVESVLRCVDVMLWGHLGSATLLPTRTPPPCQALGQPWPSYSLLQFLALGNKLRDS